MKLTKHKSQWIKAKVRKYCDILKIDYPILILTQKNYNWFKKYLQKKTGYKRTGRTLGKYLGVCHAGKWGKDRGSPDVIALNVKRAWCLDRLDETIKHELIHYAKPSYNHCSDTFRDRIKRLRLGHVNQDGRFV